MNPAYVTKRLDAALRRIGGMENKVYLRVGTVTGGNSLIGRPGSITYTDTLFDPQPSYRQVGKQAPFISADGTQVDEHDYMLTFSASAATGDTFSNPHTFIVVKPSNGGETVMKIIYWNSTGFGGQSIVLSVIARSVDRS